MRESATTLASLGRGPASLSPCDRLRLSIPDAGEAVHLLILISIKNSVRDTRIELVPTAWEAVVLPLN